MAAHNVYDIGSKVKMARSAAPIGAAGAVNGAAIDRQGFGSCVLFLNTGAATGTPATQAADAKLQESADGSTGWTDIANAAVTQIVADNGSAYVDVNLRTIKRYVRVVQTIALTGGTTPAWPVASNVVLGGADVLPTL